MTKFNITGLAVALVVIVAALCWVYMRSYQPSNIRTAPKLAKIHREYGNPKDNSKIQYVSLINLIATPEKYNGKWVRVIGVANFEFEGDALFLSKSDYTVRAVTKNAVWLSPDTAALRVDESTLAKEFNGQYILVEGIYDMNNHGHWGLYSGAITNVSRIVAWTWTKGQNE